MSPRVPMLLVKGACAHEGRRGLIWVLVKHLVVPLGTVCFVTFIGTDVTDHGGWPMLAIALAVWLLFANGFALGGMTLWHERRLLDGSSIRPWVLAVTAAVVPAGLFVLHLALLGLGLVLDSQDDSVAAVGLVVPAALALAAGLGAGAVVARLCGVAPRIASSVPGLLMASLILTPVLYPLSALEGAGDAWCAVNPVCAATELARADIADSSSPLSGTSVAVAAGMSVVLLGLGLFLIRVRRPRPSPRGRANEPELVLTQVGTLGGAHGSGRGIALAARLAGVVRALVAGLPPLAAGSGLHDVELTMAPGESVAVVGAAGPERTALLGIAARSRRPPTGRVHASGGAVSLIDPREGVHSSLSGRDNLVLRALSGGRTRADARARAATALEFAELHDVADQPVRSYSDGALIRLAVALCVFGDARVMVVDDDVLGREPVFRYKLLKCLPALRDDGRSVLFASDDVGKLGEICSRAVWLDGGTIRMDAPTRVVLDRLLAPQVSPGPADPPGDLATPCRVAAVQLLDEHGAPAEIYTPGAPIAVAVELEVRDEITLPYLICSIAGPDGTAIVAAENFIDDFRPACLRGRSRIECRFEGLTLAPRQRFAVRFAMYANDRLTVLYPKRVIATFVTGGSAASRGFLAERAEERIQGTAPVLVTYSWLLPGTTERRFFPADGPVGETGSRG